ncbi:hypothetical protein HETIRDRAFT_327882, partial [Heterobasidion irregulare TC 32-1]
VKCGPSAAKCPLVGYGWLSRDRPCLVIVGIFGTYLALFSVSSKLPKYLSQTLAW